MLSALFKRKGRTSKRGYGAQIPFQVECGCGHTLAGMRRDEAQSIKCPRCSASAFIFPFSPLTDLRQTIRDGLRRAPDLTQARQPAGPTVWRKPLLAAGVALTVVVAVFLVIFKNAWWPDSSSQPPLAAESPVDRIAAGRLAMADLNYAKAAEHFRAARAIAQKGNSGEATVRWLAQMEAEASATADLLDITLEEVLRKAAGLSDRAWKNQFDTRYAGRTIQFDTLLLDAGNGVYRVDFPIEVVGVPVRIEIHRAAGLQALNVQWPARCVFAIRLSEARRERGAWLVIAKPDVVLFTEPAFFQGSSVPVDADLVDQLKKQAAWLNVTPPIAQR